MASARFGQRPSSLAGIEEVFGENDPGCLDFNIGCGIRLIAYETQCRKDLSQRIAFEVSKIFGDGKNDVDYDGVASSYAPAPHPLTANDPYADANTQVW